MARAILVACFMSDAAPEETFVEPNMSSSAALPPMAIAILDWYFVKVMETSSRSGME